MPEQNRKRRLTGALALPDVLRAESSGSIALLLATVAALLWANLAPGSYAAFWSTHLALPGPRHALTLESWVNEGLMAVFFFVVGLEIKREFVDGELRDPRTAAVPIAAACGGMALPAAIFLAVTAGTRFGHGWGIPMATDIAFAVGVFRLAGKRAPSGIGLMLLTLAIVDDLGAIAVIAIFYSTGISPGWLLAAVPVILFIVALRRWVEHPVWFIVPAIALWVLMLRSGVHATIAGVVLGLLTPVRIRGGRPLLTGLEHRVQPWSNFIVLPLFALANAGIAISREQLHAAVTSPLALGIVAGLVLGKLLGITGGTWIATRLGGRLPRGVGVREVVAIGLLGGIGFTVSLFIADLTLTGADLNTAKLAILAASVAAAIAATLLLQRLRPHSDAPT